MDNTITIASNLKRRLIMIDPLKKDPTQKKQQNALSRELIICQEVDNWVA